MSKNLVSILLAFLVENQSNVNITAFRESAAMVESDDEIQIWVRRPDNFAPRVEISAIYVETKNRLLLLQRNGSEKGFWGLPAGKIEYGETPGQAAIRELKEETGLDIPSSETLLPLGLLYCRKPDFDYVYHAFSWKIDLLPEVEISDEHQGYGWFLPCEADSLPLMIGGRAALRFYREISDSST